MGRKKKLEITPDILAEIKKFLSLTMTQEEIYNYYGISKDAWYARVKEYPELSEAIKKSQFNTNAYVASKLMDQIKKGNVAAIIFFLKTRAGWKETNKLEISNHEEKEINIKNLPQDPIEASRFYKKIME